MRRFILAAFAAATLLVPAGAVRPPENWDGLIRVPGKRVDLLYLKPEANVRPYTRIMFDPPEIAFDKHWRRNYERSVPGHLGRLSDKEIRAAIDDGRQMLVDAYAAAFRKAGYEIVSEPDEDVLRLSIALLNVQIVAPDELVAGRVDTFSEEAGRATLVLEVRDSLSGTLLGRVVDLEILDDSIPMLRTRVSNRSDFDEQFRDWARISAEGLNALKSAPPAR